MTFVGLVTGLYFLANVLWGILYVKIIKRQKKLALRNQAKDHALEGNTQNNGRANISISMNKEEENKESSI